MSRTAVSLDRQCQLAGLPVPVAEHRFHPIRRWRFDYAFLEQKVAIEIDGGAFLAGGGRHTRGVGFERDCEKLNAAAVAGWRLLRFSPRMVQTGAALDWITRILQRP